MHGGVALDRRSHHMYIGIGTLLLIIIILVLIT